ncbi:MAG: lipase family protein [Pseudomonadota bacterium]
MTDSGNVAPTLASRLACACNCAYGIDANTGRYTPPAIYDAGVGWIGDPTAISAPEATQPEGPHVNACLVGLSADGIVVAFRGTLPPAWTVASLEDWWQDIVDSEPVAAPPLPGKVHSGFLAAVQTIWNRVLAAVQALQAANPTASVLVTGHSKGGPLASIGAAMLQLSENVSIAQVVTFASPHPGDQDFVAGYPSDIAVTRYENYLDIVPFLPPTDEFYKLFHEFMPESWQREFCSWFPSICKVLEDASHWHYTSLGELRYVTSDGEVLGSDHLKAEPWLRLIEIVGAIFGLGTHDETVAAARKAGPVAMSESGLGRIGAAHCIACKSNDPNAKCAGGYMTGSGGDIICPSAA